MDIVYHYVMGENTYFLEVMIMPYVRLTLPVRRTII